MFLSTFYILFQFYLSSIKSCKRAEINTPVVMFQFYLSSIKSEGGSHRNYCSQSFNSTLVQLKAS